MFWSTRPFPCGSAGCEREICEAELLKNPSVCHCAGEEREKKVETVLPCFECILGTGCHFRTSCASLVVLALRMCFVSPPSSQTVPTKHKLRALRDIHEWQCKVCHNCCEMLRTHWHFVPFSMLTQLFSKQLWWPTASRSPAARAKSRRVVVGRLFCQGTQATFDTAPLFCYNCHFVFFFYRMRVNCIVCCI